MKVSALAPVNIAITKYWGKLTNNMAENDSIALVLDGLFTHTTVEFSTEYDSDTFTLEGEDVSPKEFNRLVVHLDRIRTLANSQLKAKVMSRNNFPTATGLSSSASGFAALTLAASVALGVELTEEEMSNLARLGSGSACRSIPSGIVEWDYKSGIARTIYPPNYWQELRDVVVVVNKGRKEVPTSEGHLMSESNPFFKTRLKGMGIKNERLRDILKRKSFTEFGEFAEAEALELHAMMLTSGLIYLQEGTIKIAHLVKYKWRPQGLPVYFTLNTGQDVHLLVLNQHVNKLLARINKLNFVKGHTVASLGDGVTILDDHLY